MKYHYFLIIYFIFLITVVSCAKNEESDTIENNSNQLLSFTKIIKENSMDTKKEILEHLWKIVISDKTIDQFESNLLRRICGLIYVPDKISAEIKLKLLNTK